MSLLEDIFLHDETEEARELERVIEGDTYDERPRSLSPDSDSPREDEAEEEKRRVDPKKAAVKRVVKNPRFTLNPARLTGPRGIHVIPEHFKDFKFKGKGHEKEDLDLVLKKLEHWAYRLYPKFQFDDCLKKIESLGKKKPVMVNLHKIRTDQFVSEETVVQKDSSDDEAQLQEPEEDEFDKLLQQQIEIARATPVPGSAVKTVASTPINRSIQTMPNAMASPSLNEEQRERMLANRRKAEEKRLARLKQSSEIVTNDLSETSNSSNHLQDDTQTLNDTNKDEREITTRQNRSNIIDSDSSGEENDLIAVNQSIAVDVHNSNQNIVLDQIDDVVNDVNMNETNEITNDNVENNIPFKNHKLSDEFRIDKSKSEEITVNSSLLTNNLLASVESKDNNDLTKEILNDKNDSIAVDNLMDVDFSEDF